PIDSRFDSAIHIVSFFVYYPPGWVRIVERRSGLFIASTKRATPIRIALVLIAFYSSTLS
ncbi:hypothetical protein, partial [Bacillus licheniformis]|uniref:hypothetical protein n=1 Tax=Bacillus licheniformis TaxID=1402 RepID=UPI001CBC20E3